MVASPVNQKTSLVDINEDACKRLASLIRTYSIPIDREDIKLEGCSPREIGNFYFFLVAICHQTSPRGLKPLEGIVNGNYRRGWDYLLARFEVEVRKDKRLLCPDKWVEMSGGDLSHLFCDPATGPRLSQPQLRAELIQNLGSVMVKNSWLWVEDIYALCGGRIATGSPNLLDTLAQFQAYRDPAKKKSCYLLAVLRNSGIWKYVDNEKLGPPVDYHEVRGHLRIGTVRINDKQLATKLFAGIPVTAEEDIAIRLAVYEAIMLLSHLTGLRNPSQLHYLFWNVFRSCCTRESPHCHHCPPQCSLPDRYVPLAIHADGHRACPFAEVCSSVDTAQKLNEHVFETDFY